MFSACLVPRLVTYFKEPSDYQKVLEMYNESHRYYHNVDHIQTMIRDYNLLVKHNVILTVLFHDAVYNPVSSSNESDSAQLAENMLNNNANHDYIINTIIDTQTHICSEEIGNRGTILDLDMKILASEQFSEYHEYSKSIRSENSHLKTTIYNEHRMNFLKTCLSSTVFNTDYFKNKFEHLAHRNMKKELKSIANR